MLRRRALMDLLTGGSGVLKYGYFDVKPEIDKESWQVNTDDFVVEAQTDLDVTPKKLMCIYMDEKETFTNTASSIFVGSMIGSCCTSTASNGISFSVQTPFVSPDSLYLRFDESTKKIYMHVPIWRNIKCGKWAWIAIYDE